MKHLKRYLILTHRYAGIPLSVVFVIWFLSGIVMIYSGGMPTLTEAEHWSRQADLDLSALQLGPDDAMIIAGQERDSLPELRMLYGRPLYQFPYQNMLGVYADTGETLSSSGISSRRLAADFLDMDEDFIHREGTLEESDQWTIGIRGWLPLEKFTVEDGEESVLYVSPQLGRVVLHTTSRDRLLAWAGAIPHWFYIESLRENASLWTQVIIWTAALASIFTVLGLVLLFTQWRKTHPFNLGRSIPYQGLPRWHYVLGGIFGVFALTWAFSGMMSVGPFGWSQGDSYLLSPAIVEGVPAESSEFTGVRSVSNTTLQHPGLKAIRFTTVQSEPYLQLVTSITERGAPQIQTTLVHADSLTERQSLFDAEEILALIQQGSELAVAESETLNEYDNYYYSRFGYHARTLPLPVLRVKFDDALETWYYFDLNSGGIVFRNDRLRRAERWLYNGLHSLDFKFWYGHRPLWDIGLIILLLGGTALSVLGGYLGIKRLLS